MRSGLWWKEPAQQPGDGANDDGIQSLRHRQSQDLTT